jgi:hypothetical protein
MSSTFRPWAAALSLVAGLASAPRAAASPTAPAASLRLRAGVATLQVCAPEGEHVNLSGPARLEIDGAELRGLGDLSGASLPVRPADAPRVAQLEVPLCENGGQTCRLATLVAELPAGPLPKRLVFGTPVARAVEAGSGPAVRIYDFSAVWCPPCNQMKFEVLDDPENAAELALYDVQVIDVDKPESWPLKSRYAVGGYPTLVAVDAQGRELSRYLGYRGEADLLGWLRGLAGAAPLDALRAGPSLLVEHAVAAATARSLAEMGELDAARAWLAASAPGSLDYHLAHLALDPVPADADFLVAHAPPGEWVPVVIEAWPERWAELAPHVSQLSPELAAWAFSAHAAAAPPTEAAAAAVARWAAVNLVEGLVTDDLERSRPHVTWLASLRAEAGDLPGALSLLSAYAAAFPTEFTFEHAAAGLLLDAGRLAEAEAHANAALALAYGDQRLRAVVVLARALDGQGRRTEAAARLRAERAASPQPSAEDRVRTTRYIDAVDAILKEWGLAP